MAPWIAHFWIADASACNAALQATGSRWAIDACETLARIHTFCHGAHAPENEHR